MIVSIHAIVIFLSASLLGLGLGIIVHIISRYPFYDKFLKLLEWEQKTCLGSKIFGAIIMANTHVLLDASFYPEICECSSEIHHQFFWNVFVHAWEIHIHPSKCELLVFFRAWCYQISVRLL